MRTGSFDRGVAKSTREARRAHTVLSSRGSRLCLASSAVLALQVAAVGRGCGSGGVGVRAGDAFASGIDLAVASRAGGCGELTTSGVGGRRGSALGRALSHGGITKGAGEARGAFAVLRDRRSGLHPACSAIFALQGAAGGRGCGGGGVRVCAGNAFASGIHLAVACRAVACRELTTSRACRGGRGTLSRALSHGGITKGTSEARGTFAVLSCSGARLNSACSAILAL